MWNHRDKIIFENVGHDHLADFRTHSAKWIFDTEQKCYQDVPGVVDGDYFLNKMLNPAITPTRSTSPGYSMMEYDPTTDTISNVSMTFIQMESTVGKPKDSLYSDFEWLYVDYDEDFGLESLSGAQIHALHDRLQANPALFAKYMNNKAGFSDESENKITMPFYDCLQMNSMFLEEFDMCMEPSGVPTCIQAPTFYQQ